MEVNKNIEVKFWATFGSFLCAIISFCLCLYNACTKDPLTAVLLIPIILFSIFQSFVNYDNLTKTENDRH